MTDATAPSPATSTQKLAAEALGTFVLVVLGVGAALAAGTGSGDYVSIGLAFGLALVAMVYAFGRISGGHFNPAVSVGAAIAGRIPWRDAGLYAAAQVAGALAGGVVLMLVMLTGDTGWEFGDWLGANGFGDEGGVEVVGALIVELVMTFIFVLVVLAVTDTRNEHPGLAPLVIGLTLAAVYLASMWATGGSVNPARSLGVAFFSGTDYIIDLWLFIVAPLLGAAAAGLAYPGLFGRDADRVPGSGLRLSRPRAAAPAYGTDQYQQQWNQQQPVGGGYAAPVEQPIIQDGWQWDPQAQQWIPAQQPPAQQQGGWPAPDQGTQTRPPE